MVLYHAISTYQLLECIVHKIQNHTNEKSILLLPDFIVQKHDNFFQLVQLNLFNELYLFPYTMIKHEEKYIEENIVEISRKTLPYELSEFSEIYVAGAHFYFSLALIKSKIFFSMFEDAPLTATKYKVLYENLKKTFPVHAEIAEKYGLFDGRNVYIKNQYVMSQEVNRENYIQFSLINELQKVDESYVEKIARFFGVDYPIKNLRDKEILLTERFSSLGLMKEQEQITLYKKLVSDYFDERNLIIKPHPDDTINYKKVFPKATCLKANFPIEILSVMCTDKPKCIVAFESAGLESMRTVCEIKKIDIERILGEKNESSSCNTCTL